MDTMKTPSEYVDASSPEAVAEAQTRPQLEINVDAPLALPPAKSTDQWRQVGEQISSFLSELPDYLGQFFSSYQRPLITIGLVLAGFVSVKVALAVLDAINDIPLTAPFFELVGIGYTGWFVYRYLLRASSREELGAEFNALKGQVVGQDSMNT